MKSPNKKAKSASAKPEIPPSPASPPEKREPAVGFVHTTEMSALLQSLNISLLVTTYQAQRIMSFSPNGEKLFMLMRVFERPTGLARDGHRLALVTRIQVWNFEPVYELRDPDGNLQPYDLCFVPRRSHVTGDIAGHEAAFVNGELVVVNTRFSCFSTLRNDSSFVPGWRPPFVTETVPEDRCHLNGIAADEKGIYFASALGATNHKEGWRENKANGGLVMHVPSGEIVSREISMPHSPRLYRGKLWILESGRGQLQVIDEKTGKRTTVVQLPGYLRGLAFHDRFAFVGLCKIRDKKDFGGLPIEEHIQDLKCAIYVVDLSTGAVAGFIEFTKGIEELFDIVILPGVRRPHIIGFEEETINGIFVLPEG